MKKLLILLSLSVFAVHAYPQSSEVQQLLLNVEKLKQFKQILADMKKGYQIIYHGYGTIKDLSEGNFNLHQLFINGLMEASPAVRKYYRVAEIGKNQLQLLQMIKQASKQIANDGLFRADELKYFNMVTSRIYHTSMNNLDDLMRVLSDGELEMSDLERLDEIDRIYSSQEDQLTFLHHFISEQQLLAHLRKKALNDNRSLIETYDIKTNESY